jgi:hypothetical protein
VLQVEPERGFFASCESAAGTQDHDNHRYGARQSERETGVAVPNAGDGPVQHVLPLFLNIGGYCPGAEWVLVSPGHGSHPRLQIACSAARAQVTSSSLAAPLSEQCMLYYWLFFFFVAFGSKVLLAFAMIYLLLPSDAECGQCGEVTLLIRPHRLSRYLTLAVSAGRVQWRWCPGCGWAGLARRRRAPVERSHRQFGPGPALGRRGRS